VGTVYGDSYGDFIDWRLIYRVKCMETHLVGTMNGDSYSGYNIWGLI